MQYPQGGDYTSPYYPNPYTTTTSSPYPNPSPIPTTAPTTNPNPMDFNPSNPIQSSYASAPPYTPYPPEFQSAPSSYSYPQPPQSQYPSQFEPQASQFPSYPPHNPTQYPPDPSPSPSPVPASHYPNFSPPNPSPYHTPDVTYETGMSNQYGRSMSALEPPNMYNKKPYEEARSEGVYAYNGGGNDQPYGARGIMGNSAARSNSSSGLLFDDYGRSISTPSSGNDRGKIVKAVPKMDAQTDVKSGVQKYRVKLLPEGAGSNLDVLCQVGLDGIKMLDPNTSRLLRIYPLETLTRWEVLDSSIFAFWSKSTVDVEPRRIRLKSNSYTTSTILDTVTAATVQFKEMGGGQLSRGGPASDAKVPEQSAEKKKVFWLNLIKPPIEEKDHWVPDEAVTKCTACGADFGAFVRRHHCRNCGDIFCDKCTHGRIELTAEDNAQPVRVCDRCMAEVSQRLNNVKEAANRPIVHSHEDLARKLQDEMDKNRKSSSASKSESGRRMREVACPVCTVHLQVQVPTSGSETIECGVCQHPFLVSAH